MMRRLALHGGLVALACIAALSVAVHPALAASPSIALSVGSGTTGTLVSITGTGFPAGELVGLYIDLAGPYLDKPGPRADAQGAFQKTITWPDKNYDASGRVNPTAAGTHNVCGDTSYAGTTQPIEAHACAIFLVEAAPSPSASATPSPSGPVGPSPISVAIVIGILIGLAVVIAVLIRRAR
jgi:hypothetical protein